MRMFCSSHPFKYSKYCSEEILQLVWFAGLKMLSRCSRICIVQNSTYSCHLSDKGVAFPRVLWLFLFGCIMFTAITINSEFLHFSRFISKCHSHLIAHSGGAVERGGGWRSEGSRGLLRTSSSFRWAAGGGAGGGGGGGLGGAEWGDGSGGRQRLPSDQINISQQSFPRSSHLQCRSYTSLYSGDSPRLKNNSISENYQKLSKLINGDFFVPSLYWKGQPFAPKQKLFCSN